ncbi:MAG: hypothetical protein ACK4RK_15510 [Gemmataceae bacterium]
MIRSATLILSGCVAAVVLLLAAAPEASACEYKTVVCYQTVVTYETRVEPYTVNVTLYDHCGKPYQVTKVLYREVRVPVTKVVAVPKVVRVNY